MKNQILRRQIHPVVKVIDEKQGLVEYIASDESIDSYGEIIRADGWLFDRFEQNAPFVDSHDYSSIGNCLGKVVDFAVRKQQLVETVKWAIDAGLPEDHLANLGFKMTAAGYLKAVSVGFIPVEYVTPYDRDTSDWRENCETLQMDPNKTDCRCIYVSQQQIELSACCIGANMNAVAKAYKAGLINDAALELFSAEKSKRETANPADGPAAAALARQRAQSRFLVEFELALQQL